MTETRGYDLSVACIWALVALLIVLVTDNVLLRTLISAPLIFFLTGHTLLRAIGPAGTSLLEHVVYSVGASIATCILGGFVLNWGGWLTPTGWAVWLAATTCVATLIAFGRKRNGEAIWRMRPRLDLRAWQVAVLGMAVLICTSAYLLAIRDATQQRQFKYTEFWMLYGPKGAPGRLVVGLKSAEARPERYDVEVALDGRTIAMWRALAVKPGDSWIGDIALSINDGHQHKAEAWLYLPNHDVIYRKVSTIIPAA